LTVLMQSIARKDLFSKRPTSDIKVHIKLCRLTICFCMCFAWIDWCRQREYCRRQPVVRGTGVSGMSSTANTTCHCFIACHS